MAPEQVRGLAADHHADIFAFGVVLYEMLSGRRAFQGATAIDTMTAILKEDPPDLPIVERHIPPRWRELSIAVSRKLRPRGFKRRATWRSRSRRSRPSPDTQTST